MSQTTSSDTSPAAIAIVGAGAVGGLLAVLLHRAGVEVVVVARPATARTITADGIRLQSTQFGDGHAMVPALTEVPSGARVILATKAFAVPGLVDELAASRPTELVSLLNGIEHMKTLRASVPSGLLAGGSIAVETTRLGPAVIEHRSPFLRLTVPADAADSAIVAAWRSAGLTVVSAGSEAEVLWSKLRFLAPMALLTAYWQQPIGAAVAHDQTLTAGLLAEVAAIATLDGVPTAPDQLIGALTALPPAMRSSLQGDLEHGHQNELDAIGGALVRRGEALGADSSILQRIVADLGSR